MVTRTQYPPIRNHVTVKEIVVKVQIQEDTPDGEWQTIKALLDEGLDIETMIEEYLQKLLPLETGQWLRCKQSEKVVIH